MCSSRCHNWRAEHGIERPRWLDERRCRYCDKILASPDVRVRYCDDRCRRRYSSGSSVGKPRTCGYCGVSFVVTNGKQRYCSKDCRIRANHTWGSATNLRRCAEARGTDRGERFTLLGVCATYGWICGLCISPIDPSVRGDRFLEGTVDHVVPITAGGEHSLSNVQPAHWTCNAAKRDSTDVITMSVPGDGRRVIVRWPEKVQPRKIPNFVAVRTPIPPPFG